MNSTYFPQSSLKLSENVFCFVNRRLPAEGYGNVAGGAGSPAGASAKGNPVVNFIFWSVMAVVLGSASMGAMRKYAANLTNKGGQSSTSAAAASAASGSTTGSGGSSSAAAGSAGGGGGTG